MTTPGIRPLVAGNWKMNGQRADGAALARAVVERARGAAAHACELLVCPPATLIAPVADALAGSAVALGGQDCHAAEKGAHTGDIAAPMLKDLGCRYVIVGHSERRTNHGEADAAVRAKAMAARAAGLVAIVCVGETLAERDAGRTIEVVGRQLAGSVPDGATASDCVVAYEPVWAIGTGRTPTSEEIAEVHARLRALLAERFPGGRFRLLYGGSVNAKNAATILPIANVDGALVGGASLVAEDFWTIAQAATRAAT
ncbi:MAG: triose-phosphate isomerase [Alphaproteobacteria bacterium]|nr:triose-phosphate isomerase [Alphaproteobacteria bacterium]